MKTLFDQYLEFLAGTITVSTAETRRTQLAHFFRHFKGVQPRELDGTAMAGWLEFELKTLQLNPNTVIGHVKEARRFLEWCKGQGLILINPAAGLPKIRRAQVRKVPFTTEQYVKVLAYIQRADVEPYWHTAVVVAWHTGLRLSDVAAVAWANVDFDAWIVRSYPKKKESLREILYIPIEPELQQLLSRLVVEQSTDWVNPRFKAMYDGYRTKLAAEFRTICDACLLPDHSFHSFRHGLVTRLIDAGVDPVTICSITGHSLDQLQEYAHVGIDAKRRAMEKAKAA